MKELIVYFSATNNTRRIAELIKEVTSADIFEIEPVNKYTDEDIDWESPNSRINIEIKDPSYRCPIKNKVENFDLYDVIYIGFPVWWYTCPSAVKTFLESYNFKNKKVIVFCTSGSTLGNDVYDKLKDDYSFIKKVTRLSVNSTKEQIEKWISEEKN